MTVTLDDIEREVKGSAVLRMAMNNIMKELENAVKCSNAEIVKGIILGKTTLNDKGHEEVAKRYGAKGKLMISAVSNLTIPQKQYIFKRMGWDISEVTNG